MREETKLKITDNSCNDRSDNKRYKTIFRQNFPCFDIIPRRPLAVIAGIIRRNENLAAVSRFNPAKSPPIIVEPERLAPGNKAKTCENPTIIASNNPKLFYIFSLTSNNSAKARRRATAINIIAIIQRFFVNAPSISFLNNNPTIANGNRTENNQPTKPRII